MNKNSVRVYIFAMLLLLCNSMHAITLVYNMRVNRAFRLPDGLKIKGKHVATTALPIYYHRTSTPEVAQQFFKENRSVGGVLFNGRYIPSKYWWAELTTGVERDAGHYSGNSLIDVSRVGFDDVVLTAGHRHFFPKEVQWITYGLLGIPTRRKVTLDDRFGPLVGTRFVNLGVGTELSYSFSSNLKRSTAIIAQGRFVHSFDRSWSPILPEGSTIIPGNFSDLLIAIQHREKLTVYQGGYDLTIFSNQGIKVNGVTTKAATFLRHSFYVTIMHAIVNGFFEKPTVLGAGLSVSKTKQFDARNVITWFFLTQVF